MLEIHAQKPNEKSAPYRPAPVPAMPDYKYQQPDARPPATRGTATQRDDTTDRKLKPLQNLSRS